ncbi:uncharacterized protein METZ01_LOCUS397161 [marine metagenome]|uniref:Uncharacterized protein n=1 Tax=marine metagenome TaxID=408172 RepID=A0A382VCY0_9ZZZZ
MLNLTVDKDVNCHQFGILHISMEK